MKPIKDSAGFLIVIKTVSNEGSCSIFDHRQKLQQRTVAKAAAAGEPWSLSLREGRFALHFFPQGQNLFLIVEHALLVHIFQPQFLHTITAVGVLHKTANKKTNPTKLLTIN